MGAYLRLNLVFYHQKLNLKAIQTGFSRKMFVKAMKAEGNSRGLR